MQEEKKLKVELRILENMSKATSTGPKYDSFSSMDKIL